MLKILGWLKNSITWLYALVADQTKIKLIGQHSNTHQPITLLVPDEHGGDGSLLFGITTSSNSQVEILRVELNYSAPLQLLDPKSMGFFQSEGSNDVELPFRIYCEGKFPIDSKIIQVFSLTTRFPLGIRELPVRITVYARTVNSSVGDFETFGRSQITKKLYHVVTSSEPLRGIAVPPLCSITSHQPFLIQSAVYGRSEEPASVIIHQQKNDGTVSSQMIELPGALPKPKSCDPIVKDSKC